MLHLHRAERADGLVGALRSLLSDPLPDAFAAEVVAVPTRGVERWLAQRLSGGLGASPGGGDGVCANVAFPFPRDLVTGAVAIASGIDPDADRWVPERAVWPLLEVVEESLHEPWLRALSEHLGATSDPPDETRRARRFGAVRHLAGLFDRYALHRPGLVEAWSRGDGHGWQAELWRRLRARIPQPDPAERTRAACERLRSEPGLVDLPARLSVFGLTRLPAARLAILRALAEHRDVHLFLLHPSPVLWERVAAAAPAPVVRRRDDPTAELPRNRLLASWGHDVRELQLVLHGAGEVHRHPVDGREDTLLARLQADVRADRRPPGVPLPGEPERRPLLEATDRSLEVHACHGRARQVEVVRDAILHLLQDDPSLEPRDVIVLCPDIETFAPLVHATFGAARPIDDEDEDPVPPHLRPPDLRVRLADRSIRQTNPVLGVVARLLDLADQRLTASQVLDLADREPVRRRFGLDDGDLARVEDWVAGSGIRWGLDAAHRAPFKLEAVASGTWRAGLDRLLAGVTMTEDGHRLFEGVLPLDDVESGAIDLAGRVAELVDRLGTAVAALTPEQPVRAWAEALAAAADALTATTPRDAWQRAELQRLLDDVVSEAGGHEIPLALPEVRALLAERLQGRPTRANFRTGHLTFCTLVPMRSVPHRVVCLLGLDDGAFPRRTVRDGDDLLLDDPHVGDRDARTEDRQLLLDAVMAATDRLIVTYTGRDERTNAERPPAVPVGELLDVVDRTVRVDGGEARDRVVVRHPLQPFDPRNFTPGGLVPERTWSFDRVVLEGARALTAPRAAPPPFLPAPLAAPADPLVEVEELVRFLERPARAFLRRRLGISVAEYDDEIADALPVDLDNLERWGVGQRLLDARLRGATLDAAVAAERARGALPPGRLGDTALEAILPAVEDLVVHASQALAGASDPSSVDVKALLRDGRTLSGTVPGVRGELLTTITYSRVNPRHRLAAWARLLALCAAHPGRRFEALTLGRLRFGGDRDASVTLARIGPIDAAEALELLDVVVDLHDRGMREPVPLYCFTSAAYAQAAAAGRDAAAAAAREWATAYRFPKEDREPEHQLVLGGVLAFEALLADGPRADEAAWPGDEATRLGRYARRLWEPLLRCEAVTDG